MCSHKLVNCIYQVAESLAKEPSTIVGVFSDRQLIIQQASEGSYNVYEKKDESVNEIIIEDIRFLDAQIYVLFGKGL